MISSDLRGKIENLYGPILVLGASGFIGANLFRMILNVRKDVYGTAYHLPAWRLEGLPEENIVTTDLLVEQNLKQTLDEINPLTIFNCIAYGAYSFESETSLIYRTNLNFTVSIFEKLEQRNIRAFIHAGSSSEYGALSSGPSENNATSPNSHYAASKAAASGVIYFMGTERGVPCANLRLYSVYGPYEDPSRLIPKLVEHIDKGELPEFVDPNISRDFVYVDDACRAFIETALNLKRENFGESFNIGSGQCTTIGDVAATARELFNIQKEPEFTMATRDWDVPNWYANPERVKNVIDWEAITTFKEGLRKTFEWFSSLEDKQSYLKSSKKFAIDYFHSVSAVVACYKDAQAIPIMHKRLSSVFNKIGIDYEIIYVNDCSPDDSEEVIKNISARDRKVTGISHSRNFGSQAAFRSGMEISTKNACVLLDGDLQDPPELIEKFVEKWREGYDVVYGKRVKREASWCMLLAYKLFYRVFNLFSYIKIPLDAGDFSLIDRRVVKSLLLFPERDLFLRGVRAFVGYKQIGVDHVRPARLFGISTNSFFKNLGWAKKGILSFTNTPLNILSFAGIVLFGVSLTLAFLQLGLKFLFPEIAPKGITTLLLTVMLFGSFNLLAVSLIGEYIAKIFEEVKRRPHFFRRSIIRNGEIRDAVVETPHNIMPEVDDGDL